MKCRIQNLTFKPFLCFYRNKLSLSKAFLENNVFLYNFTFSLQDKKCNQERNGHATTSSQLEKIENNVILENIEAQLKELKEERDSAREKLAAHDAAAKRAITALQKEMAVRVEQVCNVLKSNFFTHDST